MRVTTSLVEEYLPQELAYIIVSYFTMDDETFYGMAYYGMYEECHVHSKRATMYYLEHRERWKL